AQRVVGKQVPERAGLGNGFRFRCRDGFFKIAESPGNSRDCGGDVLNQLLPVRCWGIRLERRGELLKTCCSIWSIAGDLGYRYLFAQRRTVPPENVDESFIGDGVRDGFFHY